MSHRIDQAEAARPHIEARRNEEAKINAACTRRCVTVAEAVSMEALAAQYPQIARLVAANLRAAEYMEGLSDQLRATAAFTARRVLEEATRLRDAGAGK